MTDRRATDLTYGQLGEATYDPEEQKWTYSRVLEPVPRIYPLGPVESCVAQSLPVPPKVEDRTSRTAAYRQQKKWLRNTLPEAQLGASLLTRLAKTAESHQAPSPKSSLLAVGKAVDIDHMSGSRTTRIIAFPSGQAGNVLRLLRPRVDNLGWEGKGGIRIRTINPAISESGYWMGSGGPIEQVVFSQDENGPTTWVAVRQSGSTTILRPIVHRIAVPAAVPSAFAKMYPPSCVAANPIVSLGSERTGSRPHVDVSFNPWYARQFAVIDASGYWSVWNIEGQKGKRVTFRTVAGKSGHLSDGSPIDDGTKSYQEADGWHRVFWAGSVSTLVMCNRREISVFELTEDLKGLPKRWKTPQIFIINSTGWILEARRSPTRLDQIFLLTTSHVMWLQITSTDELGGESWAGATIILSQRHFRDGNDETLGLSLVKDGQICIAFIYAASSPLVNVYRFGPATEFTATPTCAVQSFMIPSLLTESDRSQDGQYHELSVLPADFVVNERHMTDGLGQEYLDQGFGFSQILTLDRFLGLSETLCVTVPPGAYTSDAGSIKNLKVMKPKTRVTQGLSVLSALRVKDDFIVPDGLEEPEDVHVPSSVKQHISWPRDSRKRTSSVDARQLFELAFPRDTRASGRDTPQGTSFDHYIQNIAQAVQDREEHEVQGSSTLLELARFEGFSEDVDEAAVVLNEFLADLALSRNPESNLSIVFNNVELSLFSERSLTDQYELPDLSRIYDRLVELWVSCLPAKLPGPARLVKEKLARTIAAELCLSSIIVINQDKSSQVSEIMETEASQEMVLPVRGKDTSFLSIQPPLLGRSPGQQSFSSPLRHQPFSSQPESRPTRGHSPSGPSSEPPHQAPTAPKKPDDSGRDNIMRLRNYAASFKSDQSLGSSRSTILSHWPSQPGMDPYQYSWSATRDALAGDLNADDDFEEGASRRKQEKRRREKRFDKPSQDVVSMQSKPPVAPSIVSHYTQPVAREVQSSQVTAPSEDSRAGDIPMTQPLAGVFGSRKSAGKKASKKRRTKGF